MSTQKLLTSPKSPKGVTNFFHSSDKSVVIYHDDGGLGVARQGPTLKYRQDDGSYKNFVPTDPEMQNFLSELCFDKQQHSGNHEHE